MKRYIVYDLEIIAAIPTGDRTPEIRYCGGWKDFANMGISVIGFCEFFDRGLSIIPELRWGFGESDYLIGDQYGLAQFKRIANLSDGLIGFNSRGFDDKLLAANGLIVQTHYDLLEEVRRSAYGSAGHSLMPKGHSYKLAAIGDANGYPKTGEGGNAAVEWQKGLHSKVIEYCRNDVAITAQLLQLGLEGKLIDPNTLTPIQLRPLH